MIRLYAPWVITHQLKLGCWRIMRYNNTSCLTLLTSEPNIRNGPNYLWFNSMASSHYHRLPEK